MDFRPPRQPNVFFESLLQLPVMREENDSTLDFEMIDDDIVMEDVEDLPLLEPNVECNVSLLKMTVLENLRLRRRIRVLSTMCALENSSFVTEAASMIGAVARLYVHRRRHLKERIALQRALSRMRFHSQWDKHLTRCTSARCIQACVRGHNARRTPTGKCVAHIVDLRKTVIDLEVLVLKLSTLNCRPLEKLYIE